MQNEEIGEDIDHIGRIEFPLHPNGQTFPTKLIQDVEGSEHAPIVGSMMNKIIGHRRGSHSLPASGHTSHH